MTISTTPSLSRITIYPVKSLDGVELQKAMITEGGCLLHDREYAMSDEAGNFIIGKTNPLVHTLRTAFDFENNTISFRPMHETSWKIFHLQTEKSEIQLYLSAYFGIPVKLHQNTTGRFLDIPDKSGVTVLSTSSLQAVSGWYHSMNLEETRKRFRATLEIENVPAFWEDHLFSLPGTGIEFCIGEVKIIGMSPRARCVVPTRHPTTGEVWHGFPKTFAKMRASTQPEGSVLNEYGHHYHLSVDCHVPASEIGKWLETGTAVKTIGPTTFSL